MLQIQGRSYRCSGVVSGRLDVHVPKAGLVEDLAIGDAVESDASSQAYCRLSRLLLDMPEQGEVALLQHGLDGCGQIAVTLRQLCSGHACWPEGVHESRRIYRADL